MQSVRTLLLFDNMTFFSLSILSKSRVSSNLICIDLRLGILRPYTRLNFQNINGNWNVRIGSHLDYDWLLLHHTVYLPYFTFIYYIFNLLPSFYLKITTYFLFTWKVLYTVMRESFLNRQMALYVFSLIWRDTTVPTVPPVFCAFFSFSFLDKGREEWKEKEKKA
jgi:hypothetical protein